MSGLPFGLTGEMLNYENGGNPYRGMIYGMTGRQHPSAPGMWRFWDDFGIRDAEMLGYWNPKCPVTTNVPGMLATAYRKPGQTAIALAHWPAAGPVPPEAVVGPAAKAPTIDGTLGPGEWDAATRIVRINLFGQDTPPALPCEVFVTHDAERLYVGWRCGMGGATPKATATTRDGAVYEDDAMELFFQPDRKAPIYYQLVGNSRGAFIDGRGQDGSWNGPWDYRASVQGDGWQGELSIPFAAIGLRSPEEGAVMGFNVCRDQQTPDHTLSSWSPVRASFHDPAHFGGLVFSSRRPPTREEPRSAEDRKREAIPVTLAIDWKALGLNPDRVRITAPAIKRFQDAAEFAVGDPIGVEPAKGWILVLSEAPAR
jgi:hypothetical protein